MAGAPQVAAGKSQPLVGKPLQFDIVDEPPVNAPPINPGGPIPVASHPSGGVPTAGVPSAPAASPPRPTGQIPPRRMPKPNFDIDDPPTDVILPDQDMVDLVNSSQPSVVTSPTQTEAVYSLVPPPNRHGVIAVGVAGAILVVILLAVFVGQPDTETENLADPAAPLPTFEESADPFALPPPPDPSDEPSPAPSSTTPEPETSGVKPTPFPLPRPGRRGLPRPKPKPDEPFKPKTL